MSAPFNIDMWFRDNGTESSWESPIPYINKVNKVLLELNNAHNRAPKGTTYVKTSLELCATAAAKASCPAIFIAISALTAKSKFEEVVKANIEDINKPFIFNESTDNELSISPIQLLLSRNFFKVGPYEEDCAILRTRVYANSDPFLQVLIDHGAVFDFGNSADAMALQVALLSNQTTSCYLLSDHFNKGEVAQHNLISRVSETCDSLYLKLTLCHEGLTNKYLNLGTGTKNNTPLHHLCLAFNRVDIEVRSRLQNCIGVLVLYGVNLDVKNKDGKRPTDLIEHPQLRQKVNLFFAAISEGSERPYHFEYDFSDAAKLSEQDIKDINVGAISHRMSQAGKLLEADIKRLELNEYIDHSSKFTGMPLLYKAAQLIHGNDILKILLELGADIHNVQNIRHFGLCTALSNLCMRYSLESPSIFKNIQILVKADILPIFHEDYLDRGKRELGPICSTATHEAVDKGQHQIVQYLFDHGFGTAMCNPPHDHIHLACMHSDPQMLGIIINFYQKNGIDVAERARLQTAPLNRTAIDILTTNSNEGRKECLRLLLSHCQENGHPEFGKSTQTKSAAGAGAGGRAASHSATTTRESDDLLKSFEKLPNAAYTIKPENAKAEDPAVAALRIKTKRDKEKEREHQRTRIKEALKATEEKRKQEQIYRDKVEDFKAKPTKAKLKGILTSSYQPSDIDLIYTHINQTICSLGISKLGLLNQSAEQFEHLLKQYEYDQFEDIDSEIDSADESKEIEMKPKSIMAFFLHVHQHFKTEIKTLHEYLGCYYPTLVKQFPGSTATNIIKLFSEDGFLEKAPAIFAKAGIELRAFLLEFDCNEALDKYDAMYPKAKSTLKLKPVPAIASAKKDDSTDPDVLRRIQLEMQNAKAAKEALKAIRKAEFEAQRERERRAAQLRKQRSLRQAELEKREDTAAAEEEKPEARPRALSAEAPTSRAEKPIGKPLNKRATPSEELFVTGVLSREEKALKQVRTARKREARFKRLHQHNIQTVAKKFAALWTKTQDADIDALGDSAICAARSRNLYLLCNLLESVKDFLQPSAEQDANPLDEHLFRRANKMRNILAHCDQIGFELTKTSITKFLSTVDGLENDEARNEYIKPIETTDPESRAAELVKCIRSINAYITKHGRGPDEMTHLNFPLQFQILQGVIIELKHLFTTKLKDKRDILPQPIQTMIRLRNDIAHDGDAEFVHGLGLIDKERQSTVGISIQLRALHEIDTQAADASRLALSGAGAGAGAEPRKTTTLKSKLRWSAPTWVPPSHAATPAAAPVLPMVWLPVRGDYVPMPPLPPGPAPRISAVFNRGERTEDYWPQEHGPGPSGL